MRKIIGILLLVISISCLASGGFLLYQKFIGYNENEEIYGDIAAIAVNTESEENTEIGEELEEDDTSDHSDVIPGMAENEYKEQPKKKEEKKKINNGMTINWEELKGTKNITGWIVLGSKVNYPIMQGSDNSYYLKHAYNGASNSNGAIFMNTNNDYAFRDMNTIIYGHNLRSGRMFGTFRNYLKDKSCKGMKFYIYTPDGNVRTYEVISIAETKDGGFAYEYAFSKISQYREYLTKVKDASAYNTGSDYDVTKRVVTLSTCRSTGSAQGWRVVIVGKEVSINKVQDAASWYKKPENEHITILDIEENVKEATKAINELKRKRKEEELKGIQPEKTTYGQNSKTPEEPKPKPQEQEQPQEIPIEENQEFQENPEQGGEENVILEEWNEVGNLGFDIRERYVEFRLIGNSKDND